MDAVITSLLDLGPWGVVVAIGLLTVRSMADAVNKRADTVRSLLDERTKEIAELREDRRKLAEENARLEEALDTERAKRRAIEDEFAEFRREAASRSGPRHAHPQDSAMGSLDSGTRSRRGISLPPPEV